jgi:capsular polysaccharide biosynthesis protein
MRATCPAHLILLALITLTILGEEYKPCSSSFCSFIQPPVTSSLLGPNKERKTLILTKTETWYKVFVSLRLTTFAQNISNEAGIECHTRKISYLTVQFVLYLALQY